MHKEQKYLVRVMMGYGNQRYTSIYGELNNDADMVVFDSYDEALQVAGDISHEYEQRPELVEVLLNHFAQLILSRRVHRHKPDSRELSDIRRLITVNAHVIYADEPLLAYHQENHRMHTVMYRKEVEQIEREKDIIIQVRLISITVLLLLIMLGLLSIFS